MGGGGGGERLQEEGLEWPILVFLVCIFGYPLCGVGSAGELPGWLDTSPQCAIGSSYERQQTC